MARRSGPHTIGVGSAPGIYSPGVWRMFWETARKTEPKSWNMKFLNAFFSGRASKAEREAMIRGDCTFTIDKATEVVRVTVGARKNPRRR